MKGYKKGKEFECPFASINLFLQNFVLKVHVDKIVREKQRIYGRCCAVGHSNIARVAVKRGPLYWTHMLCLGKFKIFSSLSTNTRRQPIRNSLKMFMQKRATVENRRLFGRVFETVRESFSRHSTHLLVSSDLRIVLYAKHFVILLCQKCQLVISILKLIVSSFYN